MQKGLGQSALGFGHPSGPLTLADRHWFLHRQTAHCAGSPPGEPPLVFFDFLLSWLEVNSRCVFFKVSKKKEDNLTLAPVIDMINHAFRETKPKQTQLNALTFSSPPHGSEDPLLRKGDELCFSYGGHEDAMLLTEYGFTLDTNMFNSIELDAHIEDIFERKGQDGVVKRQILEEEGYWG